MPLRYVPHLVPVAQVPSRVSSILPPGATFVNKYIVIPHHHRVKVTLFCDINKNKRSHLSCGAPILPRAHVVFEHSERYPPDRPSEPLCNITYHVRRTIWVFHRSGTLQTSVSFMFREPAGGCSVSLKSSCGLTN